MINRFFKEKYSFLSSYFENYIKLNKRFPQSIVLEGQDTLGAYFFALELARILNCENKNDENCTCTNCKWIKEGKHPSIINVTPVDFKEDSSKTVISVKQIEKITSIINETSDYHRFFIFSDAKIAPYNKVQKERINEFQFTGYEIPNEDWYPYPLNRKILQEEASNALLKSVEEAPDKVTFIFLSDTKENIIQTITSRSLVFKVPSLPKNINVDVSEFFEDYPNGKIENLIEKTQNFIEKAQEENLDLIMLLDVMQDYLSKLIKDNLNLKELIMKDIKQIQKTKKQIKALVFPKYAIESLFIALSYEGRNYEA